MANTPTIPSCLQYTTADTVAECLPYHQHMSQAAADEMYAKLWRIQDAAATPTPLGGDGTNGTVECRGDQMDSHNDDKAPHWWAQLTTDEQVAVAKAAASEGGYTGGLDFAPQW